MGVFCGTADSAGLSGKMNGEASLKADFDTEGREFREKGTRRVDDVDDDHVRW
jgi:hypothetical protein